MEMQTATLGLDLVFRQPSQLAGRARQEAPPVSKGAGDGPSAKWALAHCERETMATINASSMKKNPRSWFHSR